MSITELPALNRTSATFKSDLNTFFGVSLPGFSSELNAEIARLDASVQIGAYTATSSTSVTVATGTIMLTINAGKSFAVGQPVVIAQSTTPANYMAGYVTAYDTVSGEMTINASKIGGSGTYTAWTISIAAFAVVDIQLASTVVLTSGTSWTNTAGYRKAKLRVQGAGGGGGRSSTTTPAPGGAAGAYAEKLIDLTPDATYSYAIGAAGYGATASTMAGTAGGTTSFTHSSSTVTCTGGGGGPVDSYQFADGGIASGGDLNLSGAYGWSGGTPAYSSHGGRSLVGINGVSNSVDSVNSFGYGAGGAGAATSGIATAGTQGVIIMELYK